MPAATRRSAFVLALAAASVGAFAASVVVAPVAAVRADPIDDAVLDLKALIKAGEDTKIIAKITDLEAKLDARVTDALADVARNSSIKSDKVRKTAMRIAAQRKHAELGKWLKGKIDDEPPPGK